MSGRNVISLDWKASSNVTKYLLKQMKGPLLLHYPEEVSSVDGWCKILFVNGDMSVVERLMTGQSFEVVHYGRMRIYWYRVLSSLSELYNWEKMEKIVSEEMVMCLVWLRRRQLDMFCNETVLFVMLWRTWWNRSDMWFVNLVDCLLFAIEIAAVKSI